MLPCPLPSQLNALDDNLDDSCSVSVCQVITTSYAVTMNSLLVLTYKLWIYCSFQTHIVLSERQHVLRRHSSTHSRVFVSDKG